MRKALLLFTNIWLSTSEHTEEGSSCSLEVGRARVTCFGQWNVSGGVLCYLQVEAFKSECWSLTALFFLPQKLGNWCWYGGSICQKQPNIPSFCPTILCGVFHSRGCLMTQGHWWSPSHHNHNSGGMKEEEEEAQRLCQLCEFPLGRCPLSPTTELYSHSPSDSQAEETERRALSPQHVAAPGLAGLPCPTRKVRMGIWNATSRF